MASGKRQPSKQKRTNQNRQERAARQARAAAAASSSSGSGSGSGLGPGGSAAARGSLLGRLRGAVAPAPRAASSSSGGASGGALGGATPARPAAGAQPVGYRAALTALLAALAAVVASFFIQQPVDAQGDIYTKPSIVAEWSATALREAQAAPTADASAIVDAIGDDWMPNRTTERMFVAYLPLSLAAALPVLGAYLLFRSVQLRRGSRIVNRAMYATLLGAFISLPLLQFFLPTVIAGWVAGFQVRRAERAELIAAQGEVVEGEVIEAEVVADEADAKADDDRS